MTSPPAREEGPKRTRSGLLAFWSKVDFGRPDECWPWRRQRNRRGYGRAWVCGRGHAAHRIAFAFSVGAIPEGMYVLHHCDNPPCCNPAHLFLGTARDNSHDSVRKGRCSGAVVTLDKASEIHATLAATSETRTAVAARFGVSRDIVSRIGLGRTWKHISARAALEAQ